MTQASDPRTTPQPPVDELDPEIAVEQLAAVEDPDPEAIVDELDEPDPRDPVVELDADEAPEA